MYGSSAITAITAQNTHGVQAVEAVDPGLVGQQIDAVLSDIGADAIKTGMLASADIVETVAARVGGRPLVVDPVLVSSSGRALLDGDGLQALKAQLLPLALVVTPNLPEAKALTGLSDPREAARAVLDMGPRAVIVKGGHLEGDADDLLYDGRDFVVFHAARVHTPHTHGTGCTFSAAIAAGLALGNDLASAVERAKRYITAALQQAVAIGAGTSPVNHFPTQW